MIKLAIAATVGVLVVWLLVDTLLDEHVKEAERLRRSRKSHE